MTSKRVITLDCNIFGLQKYGGVSNYLSVLVQYLSKDFQLAPELVLPKHISYRGFNNNWLKFCRVIHETINPKICQYLRVTSLATGATFHTPYYRLPSIGVNNYIVTVHDFMYERFRKGLPRLLHTRTKFKSIKRADSIICVSEATKKDLLEFFPWVDKDRIHVIYHGVDHEIFYPDKENIADTSIAYMALFVGQRKGYKRFDLAIDAIKLCPGLTLGIVGPKLQPKERKLLNEKLNNRWTEIGLVESDRLRRLYSSAYALIFPSEYEGFGLPILEAMACGCPVVAAQIPAFSEVGGDCVQYSLKQNAKSYSDLLLLLGYGGTRRVEVIQKGLNRADMYRWEDAYNKTRALYLAD